MKFPRAKIQGKTQAEELLDEAAALSLSLDQLGRLRHAMAIRFGTKAERRRSNEIAAEIRRELRAGLDETIALEKARGGEVVQFNTAGAVRLGARDGLASLYLAGKLEPRLAAAGFGYRRAREAQGSLGVMRFGETGGGASDAVLAGFARARLSAAAAVIDRTVALELYQRPDALDTLRKVAGDGQTIRSLAAGGKDAAHRLSGLVLALEIAARFVQVDR